MYYFSHVINKIGLIKWEEGVEVGRGGRERGGEKVYFSFSENYLLMCPKIKPFERKSGRVIDRSKIMPIHERGGRRRGGGNKHEIGIQ